MGVGCWHRGQVLEALSYESSWLVIGSHVCKREKKGKLEASLDDVNQNGVGSWENGRFSQIEEGLGGFALIWVLLWLSLSKSHIGSLSLLMSYRYCCSFFLGLILLHLNVSTCGLKCAVYIIYIHAPIIVAHVIMNIHCHREILYFLSLTEKNPCSYVVNPIGVWY